MMMDGPAGAIRGRGLEAPDATTGGGRVTNPTSVARGRIEPGLRVHTGLGTEIDAIAGRSPLLRDQIAQVKAMGFRFVSGEAGAGSWCDAHSVPPTIVVDSSWSPRDQALTVAHECAHALYTVPRDRSSRDAYVASCLRDEGNALLNELLVERQIGPDPHTSPLDRVVPFVPGGPADILRKLPPGPGLEIGAGMSPPGSGIGEARGAGSTKGDFKVKGGPTEQEILEQFLIDGDRDKAVDACARLYATYRTSNTGEPYPEYYGNAYDRAHNPAVAGTHQELLRQVRS